MASTSTSTPSAIVERAVVSKGRASCTPYMAPLILLHAPASSATKAQVFARHAHFLYHHLLGKLRGSTRYRGVVLVGLEDVPVIRHQPEGGGGGGEGEVVALDGFSCPGCVLAGGVPNTPTLDMTSPAAFVDSLQNAVPSSAAPTYSEGRRRATEDEEEEEDEEDEEEDADGAGSMALGIDSLNMLAHRLGGMQPTMKTLRKLLSRSTSSSASPTPLLLSPVLAVVHTEGGGRQSLLSPTWRLALEDLATTNIYVHPYDETTGSCFVVRKSVSGKVHEEWEGYVLEGPGHVQFCPSGTQAAAAKPDVTSAGNGEGSKKEAVFLESLPFRLSLSEQERAMRGQTVLPHERQRTASGVPGGDPQQQPLIYHEAEDFDDEDGEEEEEEYDEDADDDLDL